MIFINNINGMFVWSNLGWGQNVWGKPIRGALIIIQVNIEWFTVSIFDKMDRSSRGLCFIRRRFFYYKGRML